MTAPQARWLSDAEVAALLPPPAEAAELARAVLVALADGTIELPPKPAIHPRPDGFVNVMPAYCAGLDGSGVKLVSVFPANRERGLPAINALVIVLDSATGLLRGLLGGAALTACRTAAASARASRASRPAAPGHVAITGAGVEARTHLLALDALGLREVVVWDHRAANLEALAAWAAEHVPAVELRTAAGAAEAAVGAAVVITGIPIGASGGVVEHAALRDDALALPIDYSTSIAAETANEAELLLADDVAQLDGFRGAALRRLARARRARRPLARRRRAAAARRARWSSRTWASAPTTSSSAARCSRAPSARASACSSLRERAARGSRRSGSASSA